MDRRYTKFHGITPSVAKEYGAHIRDFAPLKIILSLEGGNMMDYRIEKKEAFTVIGRKRKFNNETAYEEIPKFWTEHFKDGGCNFICGSYGVCFDSDGEEFDYLIADDYNPEKKVPSDYEKRELAAGVWAIFPCKMKNLQDTNTRMWKEWLQNCREYKLGGNYNIEMYSPIGEEGIEESYCELWLPIVKEI